MKEKTISVKPTLFGPIYCSTRLFMIEVISIQAIHDMANIN